MPPLGLVQNINFHNSSGRGISIEPPVNIDPPTTNGTNGAKVGQVISASTPGNWTNAPTSYVYRWLKNNDAIPAAGTDEYELTVADMGAEIKVGVIAVNAGGESEEVFSDPITTSAAFVTCTQSPFVSDDNGQVAPTNLSVTDGTWDTNPPGAPLSYTYEWRNNGLSNGGASSTYFANTQGNYSCVVTATSDYTYSSQESNALSINEPI